VRIGSDLSRTLLLSGSEDYEGGETRAVIVLAANVAGWCVRRQMSRSAKSGPSFPISQALPL